jgi:hypothetical protein
MKYFSLFLLLTILVSCSKNEADAPLDYRCSVRITDTENEQVLTDRQLATISALFEKNKLVKPENIRFSELHEYDGAIFVSCDQYVNHVKVFIHRLTFAFDASGKFQWQSGKQVTEINKPSVPFSSSAFIRAAFVKELKNGFELIPLTDSVKELIADECIQLEFGYMNTRLGDTIAEFTPAWNVHPVGLYEGREVMIEDGTGRILPW